MNRLYVLAGALALAVLVTATVQADDEKDKKKVPTIKEIMKATHGKNGFRAKYEKAYKDENWKEAAKLAKDWEACAENLAKNTPPEGSKEDFEKQANAYVKNLKTLEEATDKMEKKRIQGSLGYVGGSCKKCHTAHKGK
jgi:cytochrome c556